MRKNLKEYSTPCIPGVEVYSTRYLPDIKTVMDVRAILIGYKEVVRLKYKFYKKREEIKLFDPPKDYGSIVVRYEPYKSHMLQ